MAIRFGIDLGTTYSCVAYINEDGKAETISNSEGKKTTPSVIFFDSETSQLVGDEAKEYALANPEKSVSFIKREMGVKDYKREIYGRGYRPEELSAKILKKLVQDANRALHEQKVISEDEEVNQAVITCPAYFGMAEKDATKNAGEIAGLEVLDIINEPTAAAIYYGQHEGDNGAKRILVYDLGGGTFDITVMDIDGNNVSVVCTGGDKFLGGKDWDEATVKLLLEKWQDDNDSDEDITTVLETKAAMMGAAEKAKIQLTSKEDARINFMHQGTSYRSKEPLTRADFDKATEGLLLKTIEMTDLCMEDMRKKDSRPIDEIILVGGSTYMPQIKSKLQEKYGLPVSAWEPNEAVAKGAAIYASTLTVKKDEAGKIVSGATEGKLNITNVSSRSYGINAISGDKEIIANFILHNDELPKTVEQVFGIYSDDTRSLPLDLYETTSSEMTIDDPKQVQEILKKPVKSYTMNIDGVLNREDHLVVKITIENNGLLTLEAEDSKYHKKASFSYDTSTGGMGEEELRIAKASESKSTVE